MKLDHSVRRVRLAAFLAAQLLLSLTGGGALGAYTVLGYLRGAPSPRAFFVFALPSAALLALAGLFLWLHRRVSRRVDTTTPILAVETAAVLLAGAAAIAALSAGAATLAYVAGLFGLFGLLAATAAVRLERG